MDNVRKFKWYCMCCGETIHFTCSTDMEDEHTPPVEVQIDCQSCGTPQRVLAVNNQVYKVEATIYNPTISEVSYDRIH